MTNETQDRKQDGLILYLGSINAAFQIRIARRPEISETLIASDFNQFDGGDDPAEHACECAGPAVVDGLP